jgi:hypothetical protein
MQMPEAGMAPRAMNPSLSMEISMRSLTIFSSAAGSKQGFACRPRACAHRTRHNGLSATQLMKGANRTTETIIITMALLLGAPAAALAQSAYTSGTADSSAMAGYPTPGGGVGVYDYVPLRGGLHARWPRHRFPPSGAWHG